MKPQAILVLLSMSVSVVSSCGTTTERAEDRPDRKSDDTSEPGCAQPGSVADGMRCSCAEDCSLGATCGTEADFGEPGGSCIRLCEAGDDSCSGGAVCFDFVAEYGAQSACSGSCVDDSDCGALSCRDGACCLLGLCRIPCESTSDCESGRICDAGFCTPHCSLDSDCEGGECDPYTGVCGPTDTSKAGLSEPCLQHEDCRSNYCHPPSSTCETNCSVSLGGCPEQALCVEVDPGTDLGTCAHECNTQEGCDGEFQCVELDPSTSACVLLEPEADCDPAEGGGLDPCECSAQCRGGAQCQVESVFGYPGGVCNIPCNTDVDCEAGETCSTTGYCAPACQAGECGDGRVCGSSGYCRAACTDDSECRSGLCNTYSKLCVEEEPTGAGVFGECTVHTDCKSEFCFTDIGRCVSLCSTERGQCPDDATCLSLDGGETGICTYGCEDDNGCKQYELFCVGGYCQ